MEWIESLRFNSQVVFGIIVLLVGVLLLLNNLDFVDVGPFWQYWPFILLFIGINKIIQCTTLQGIGKGIWLIFLGLWLFVSLNHIWGLSFRDTWPMILIAWGVGMMWKTLTSSPRHKIVQENSYGH
ncbi:MAG TPA: hypothetical protein DCP63_08185 [Bacteroidetes bacterium]|nr:hypothetical protein [Bacteroidota bacterium]